MSTRRPLLKPALTVNFNPNQTFIACRRQNMRLFRWCLSAVGRRGARFEKQVVTRYCGRSGTGTTSPFCLQCETQVPTYSSDGWLGETLVVVLNGRDLSGTRNIPHVYLYSYADATFQSSWWHYLLPVFLAMAWRWSTGPNTYVFYLWHLFRDLLISVSSSYRLMILYKLSRAELTTAD